MLWSRFESGRRHASFRAGSKACDQMSVPMIKAVDYFPRILSNTKTQGSHPDHVNEIVLLATRRICGAVHKIASAKTYSNTRALSRLGKEVLRLKLRHAIKLHHQELHHSESLRN